MMVERLGEKYRHLRFNAKIYQNYPFRITQIREPHNQQNKPPHENEFGFSGPEINVIEQMLTRVQDETHYISVNPNDRTFILTERRIDELRERDPSLV
jgi:hypothetical protein